MVRTSAESVEAFIEPYGNPEPIPAISKKCGAGAETIP